MIHLLCALLAIGSNSIASRVETVLVAGSLGYSQQPVVRRLEGLMFVSNDKQIIAQVQKEFKYSMPLADFAAKFTGARYVLKEWGKRSAILLDRKAGPIGELERKCA